MISEESQCKTMKLYNMWWCMQSYHVLDLDPSVKALPFNDSIAVVENYLFIHY